MSTSKENLVFWDEVIKTGVYMDPVSLKFFVIFKTAKIEEDQVLCKVWDIDDESQKDKYLFPDDNSLSCWIKIEDKVVASQVLKRLKGSIDYQRERLDARIAELTPVEEYLHFPV